MPQISCGRARAAATGPNPPPGQPVYLTHIGYYEWGQKTFDDILPPGLCVSYDGLEVVFSPPPIVKPS